jgi:deazaflavin-dependent oxidoreductase (nitroreductase family)
MPYLKPPAFARKIFNPIAMRLGIGDSHALTVAGRTTGDPHSVPVIPVEVDGVTYVVGARGETEWARNLRRAGSCELTFKGKGGSYTATELPVDQRSPVITKYRQVAGRTVAPYWEKIPADADHPVFRLTPR